MTDKKELGSTIDTGRQAEALLNQPLFIAAVKTLRLVAIEKFENLGFTDTLGMQECNIRLNLVEELESNLNTIIANGDIAFRTLEEIQTFEQEIANGR